MIASKQKAGWWPQLALAATFGVGALTLPSSVSAAPPMPRETAELGVEGYLSSLAVGVQKTRLANGLRVVLQRDNSWPLVAVNVTFNAGRNLEGAGDPALSAWARSLRHRRLLPAMRPDFALAAARGSRFSHHFGWSHTSFTQVLPANELPFALWLEAQRLCALEHSAGARERLDAEHGAALTYLEPRGGALLALERLVLGPRGSEFTAWQRLGHYFFSAQQAVLTLSGDIDPDQAMRLIHEYFGRARVPPPLEPPAAAPTASFAEPPRRLSLPQPFNGSRALALGYAAPASTHADHAALELAGYLLAGGKNASSRDELEPGPRAIRLAAGLSDAGERGLFWVFARVDPKRLESAHAALLSRMRLLTMQPATQALLERAKQAALVDWLAQFVSLERRAALLGRYEALHGDARLVTRRHSSLRAVTSEDLMRVSRRYLGADQAHLLTLEPAESPGGEP